ECECGVEARSRVIRVMRGPYAAAELDDVVAVNQRRVVLYFVIVLQIILAARPRATAHKAAGHTHSRVRIRWGLEGVIAVVLKPRLVDDFGANHLRVADLDGVLRALGVIALGR